MISSAGCSSRCKLCGDRKSNEFTVKLIIYNYHCDFYHSKSRWSITSSKPILVDVAGWTSSTNLFVICHLSLIIQNHLFKSKLIYNLSFKIISSNPNSFIFYHSSFKITSSKPILVDVAGWTSSPNSSASARVSVVWTVTLNWVAQNFDL